MQFDMSKNIEKIVTAFNKMAKIPKTFLKYGCIAFIALLFVGTILILLNSALLSYDSYLDLVSKSIIKVSFSIAAEVIIGSLVLDFMFKK